MSQLPAITDMRPRVVLRFVYTLAFVRRQPYLSSGLMRLDQPGTAFSEKKV
jgi:hypothetical protein